MFATCVCAVECKFIKMTTDDSYCYREILFFPLNDETSAGCGGKYWSIVLFSRSEITFSTLDSAGNFYDRPTKQQ